MGRERVVGGAGEEGVTQGGLQGVQGRRASLEGLEEFADLEVECGVVAAVAVEGVFGADGATLKEHACGVEVAGEAGVVECHRVPLVARVHVHPRLQKVPQSLHVTSS